MSTAAEIEIQALRDLNNVQPLKIGLNLVAPGSGAFTIDVQKPIPVPDPHFIWQKPHPITGEFEQGIEQFNWWNMKPNPPPAPKKSFLSRIWKKFW